MNKVIENYRDKIRIYDRVVQLCLKHSLKLPARSQTLGVLGELLAYEYFLKTKGVKFPENHAAGSDFDLLVGGVKYEVKTSKRNKSGKFSIVWNKNIRNGEPLFERMIVVLLEKIDSQPLFFDISADRLGGITGLNIKTSQQLMRFIE